MKATRSVGNSEKARALAEIYVEIEQRVVQAQSARPVWPCRAGCDACCRRLARLPEVTAVEWHRLHTAITDLPAAVQAAIGEKIEALAKGGEGEKRPFLTCPLLNEETGLCRVYQHRPAACRMYGFYVSRHNNQWCGQIEDLFQAGELAGAVLGNLSAMKRQIRRRCGEAKSIAAWYAESDASA